MPSTNIMMLQTVANGLLRNEGLIECVESALPFDSDSGRTGFIADLIMNIAGIE